MERTINMDELNALRIKLKDTGIELERPSKCPQEYHSLEDYAAEKRYKKEKDYLVTRFASIPAVIEAAWKLVRFFRIMQEENLCCTDDMKQSVYFHAKTGEMVFKDALRLKKYGISPAGPGQDGEETEENASYNRIYHAPELITGETREISQYTQNWSLAVYLYELFYHSGSPFVGHLSMKQVFFSEDDEALWMAREGVFTMEDNLCQNRPVHGVQDRLIKYWEYYPEILRQAFTEVFVDGKADVHKRYTPVRWQIVLNRLKNEYLTCGCGAKGFSGAFLQDGQGHCQCPKCGNTFYGFTTENNNIYLSPGEGTRIFRWQTDVGETEDQEVIGMVVENRQHKGVYGIKNMSRETWQGIFPNGEERPVPPGGGIPLWKGLQITFREGNTWKIKGAD